MSTMNDTLKQEEALFIPSEDATATPKEEYVPMVEGEYLGHITDTRTITREFTKDGKQMKARIFNFKVHVAEDNRHNTYTIHSKHGGEPKKVTGEHYVGKTIFADGVFRAQKYSSDYIILSGDVNGDGIINILDVVQVVNLILINEYDDSGDLNEDGIINILDLVQLANIILN